MYRNRSLIWFFKEQGSRLTSQRLVARCGLFQHQMLSKRSFSITVSAAQMKGNPDQKRKIFNLDDIIPVVENKSKKVVGSSNDRKVEENKDTDVKEKLSANNEMALKLRKSVSVNTDDKSDDNRSDSSLTEIEVDLEKDSDPGVTVNKEKKRVIHKEGQEIKTGKLPNSLTLYNYAIKINAVNSEEKVIGVLDNYLNLVDDKKCPVDGEVIVSALKKLERLGADKLDVDIEQKLQFYLEKTPLVTRLSHHALETLLDFFMKGSTDNQITYTVLHEVCWRLRKAHPSQVLSILRIINKHPLSTEKREEVHMLAKKRLGESINQVASPQELLKAMHVCTDTNDIWHKLEEEAHIMLSSMNSTQTYKLLYQLAFHRSRNSLLVSKACRHLRSWPMKLDINRLRNLFFACSALKVNDQKLFHDMSLNLIEEWKGDMDIATALSVLQSCSYMGWNFNQLTECIMTRLCSAELSEIANRIESVILSVGKLNLVNHKNFVMQMFKQLKSECQLSVDCTHSLACLKICDKSSAEEVLTSELYSSLQHSLKDKQVPVKMLLNLYGHYREELNGENKMIEEQAIVLRNHLQDKLKEAPQVGLARAVGLIVDDIAPRGKYSNVNVVTKYGYTIDFEMFVDPQLRAVRLDNTERMQKVWIKMLDYKGYVKGGETPVYTGNTDMMLRLLAKEKDVTIVYVPYYEWSKYDKRNDQLMYLEKLITNAFLAGAPNHSTLE